MLMIENVQCTAGSSTPTLYFNHPSILYQFAFKQIQNKISMLFVFFKISARIRFYCFKQVNCVLGIKIPRFIRNSFVKM